MRLLIAAFGSRGDVQPMLALAVTLRAAGHEAVVAARPAYAGEAAALGVPFEPVGEPPPVSLSAGPSDPAQMPLVISFLRKEIEGQLDRLPPLAAAADRVIGAGMSFGARTVAEAAGVPYLAVAYVPNVVTQARPPVPRPLEDAVRSRRAERHLPPLDADLMRHAHPLDRTLLAVDPELSGLPPVPLWKPPTGALLLDDPRPLDDRVEAFLAAGAPPVYIGFGSLTGTEPALRPEVVRAAVEAAGCRAIHAVADLAATTETAGDRILVVGSTPHSRLFPRVAAVVHHGGAGTTAAAARAGVPQVVVPHAYDQPFWAVRAHQLGLSPPPIPARDLTEAGLSAALHQVIEEPRLLRRARALAQVLAGRNGAVAAAGHVTGALP